MITIKELQEELELDASIEGLTFPANKAQILRIAHVNGSDGEALDALETLADRQYGSVTDILQELTRTFSPN